MSGEERNVLGRAMDRIRRPGPAVDVRFDFASDTPPGKDADAHSQTLRRYHQLLWTKPLPNGGDLVLQPFGPKGLLLLRAGETAILCSSDAAVPAMASVVRAEVRARVGVKKVDAVRALNRTIGGRIIFPSQTVDKKMTINGGRGTNQKIRDRFDLTLECIRRHYVGETSPLGEVLDRYTKFFALFSDFDGYVNFFLLHDLLTESGDVAFFAAFDDFVSSPVPPDSETYIKYLDKARDFLRARNKRIHAYARTLPRQS